MSRVNIYSGGSSPYACSFPITTKTIEALTDCIEQLNILVKNYSPLKTYSSYIGKISAKFRIPSLIYIRIIWLSRNEGVQLDSTNIEHIRQIHDLYLELNRADEWPDDPFYELDPDSE
jgi:hypothetical protein